MNKLTQLLERLEALRTELIPLGECTEELTDAQQARWTEANTEFDEVRTAIVAEETRNTRLEEIRRLSASQPSGVESGDGATSSDSLSFQRKTKGEDVYDLSTIRQEMRRGNDVSTELRDRALTAIEQAPRSMTDAHREAVIDHVERERAQGRHEIAEHILQTGSQQYRDDWRHYVTTGEARTSLTLSGVGAMIPYVFDPTLIITNAGTVNDIRRISTVKTITTDDYTVVRTDGVVAEWLAESAEVADATPTINTITITAHKAAAHVQLTMEAAMDSDFSSEISALFADAKDRLESTAFAVGTGSGQPYGIVTELGLVTASRVAGSSGAAGAANLAIADVFALPASLPPRFRPNAVWLAEFLTYSSVRQLGSNANAANFWTDLNADTPSMLMGRPIYESSAMDNTIVSGSNDDALIFGDFKAGYLIVDRVGMSILYNPLVIGTNRRPIGEVAWTAFWRVGARAVNPGAFRMLRL